MLYKTEEGRKIEAETKEVVSCFWSLAGCGFSQFKMLIFHNVWVFSDKLFVLLSNLYEEQELSDINNRNGEELTLA